MLISQFDNEPNAGKFVKDNVGMEGLDIEYNDAALFVIVATDVLLLVYVNAPELYDVGGVIAKGEAPYSLFTLLKLLKVGVPRLTSNDRRHAAADTNHARTTRKGVRTVTIADTRHHGGQ
jgi:hypothetical protein